MKDNNVNASTNGTIRFDTAKAATNMLAGNIKVYYISNKRTIIKPDATDCVGVVSNIHFDGEKYNITFNPDGVHSLPDLDKLTLSVLVNSDGVKSDPLNVLSHFFFYDNVLD